MLITRKFRRSTALADYLADVIPDHIERAMERWRMATIGGVEPKTDDQLREVIGFILTGKQT